MVHHRHRKAWIAGLCAGLVLSGNVCRSAEDPASPGALLKESIQAMEAGRYADASATMYMYLDAVAESKAPRVIAIAQDIRFKLATILVKDNRLDEAAAVLQAYVDAPLANHPRQAMKMLATCLYESGDYEGCAASVTNALYYDAHPVVVAQMTVKDGDKKKDKDEEEEVSVPSGNEVVEPAYTTAELTMLHLTLGEAYFALGKWEECIPPFTYVIGQTPDEQRKGYAIMQVVNALIAIPDFARITEWIPQLYRTTARFDIRVNLALMNAAAALYDAEEYDSALPLYRMILPREELIAYQQTKLRALRIAAGLTPDENTTMTAGEQMLFGAADVREAAGEEKGKDSSLLVDKPKELVDLENLIIALKNLPPYETDIQYRMAQLYKEVGRYWEGVKFFDIAYAADPASDIGERSIYEGVDTLLNDLGELPEAERRAFAHMGKYKEGMTPRQLAYMLTGYYQKHETMPAIKTLLPCLDGFVRTNDVAIAKYDAELYYMQAVADLVALDYEASEKGFKRVLDEFPGSHQEGNSLYWYGMSKLFLQKYAEAWPDFEQYVSRFPSEGWVDEAWFQGGICLFGMEKYDEALERFSFVIKNYPDSSIFPEACSMRGDIHGSKGLLDEAVADYRTAIARATKPAQATYAVFQMATVFEAEDRYDAIIQAVEAYLKQWDAEADIAKALFWIGKTKIQQERYDEAVSTYLDAIVKYGTDVRQDGVDLMIAELVKVSSIWLDTAAQAKLQADLQAALAATGDPVLQLRLRVTLA
ncbi:MAG: tetratricopeptide repeat protein, partial [Kiritimatiellales bacterium]|nr:tetratricopeptide repeat protein [Kiritimatiellales bacterium]